MNFHRVLQAVNVDLYTHVVANKEAADIFSFFFFAGVAEIEAATDPGVCVSSATGDPQILHSPYP